LTTDRQPDNVTLGRTHASSVIPFVRSSEDVSAIVTRDDVPLKLSAFPYFPAVVHVAPLNVPVFPLPDPSPAVVPSPSSKAKESA